MESWQVPDEIKGSSKLGVQIIQNPLSYKVQIFDQLQSKVKGPLDPFYNQIKY